MISRSYKKTLFAELSAFLKQQESDLEPDVGVSPTALEPDFDWLPEDLDGSADRDEIFESPPLEIWQLSQKDNSDLAGKEAETGKHGEPNTKVGLPLADAGFPKPTGLPLTIGAVISPGPGRFRETPRRSPSSPDAAANSPTLEELLAHPDESFSEMLLRKIDESGMTDAQCYKKAHVDRKLFSKIRKDPLYKPSKPTALAFAIALELSMEDTLELLGKAGFTLSHSSKFDLIVEFFLQKGVYDLMVINEALYAYDQCLLGSQAG